jgi:hypothetical protein
VEKPKQLDPDTVKSIKAVRDKVVKENQTIKK